MGFINIATSSIAMSSVSKRSSMAVVRLTHAGVAFLCLCKFDQKYAIIADILLDKVQSPE